MGQRVQDSALSPQRLWDTAVAGVPSLAWELPQAKNKTFFLLGYLSEMRKKPL